MGGSGKSTLCKKIMAWTRSQNKLALGCASTGLAAAIYDDFNTVLDVSVITAASVKLRLHC